MGTWRNEGGALYITDNGNHIIDVKLDHQDPRLVHEKIKQMPGVVETGFFFNLAHRVVIGHVSGDVVIKIYSH